MRSRFLRALAATCVLIGSANCSSPTKKPSTAEDPAWYSEVRKLYYGIPVMLRFKPRNDDLANRTWDYLTGIDNIFNAYRSDTEIGEINAAGAKGDIEVTPEMAEALRFSLHLNKLTDGAFDISVRPAIELWRAAETKGKPPSNEEVERVLGLSGGGQFSVRGNTATFARDDMKLDFGGIIKGMAVDEVIKRLKQAGVTDALVQIGGETAAFGTSPRRRPHVIGVQHPGNLNAIWTAIADTGTGISVATSGNYQQPVVIDGVTYYHIIDPRTGRPTSTRTLSVTVAFPETGKNALADGLTTAGAVLGPKQTIALVEDLGGQTLILTGSGEDIEEHKSFGWDSIVYALEDK